MTHARPNNSIQQAIIFLKGIGFNTERGEVTANSFVPNITIKNGEIVYNEEALVGDMLHEAGHLAILPAKYRSICQANVGRSVAEIWKHADAAGELEVDSPMYRALIQASDPEATAWAWAAGKEIGIAEEEIIPDFQYQGTGEEIRSMLSARCYLGINGLRAAGMLDSVKTFPKLTRWVQL